MGNRSNINLVGNTTQGQNVGIGTDVYKGKALGNILQYKTLSVTGTTMVITSDDDNIYFSAATSSGGTGGTSCIIGWTCAGTSKGVSVGCNAYPYAAGSFLNNEGNTAIGVHALTANTTGYYNTVIGFDAMCSNTTGGNNVSVGSFTLASNTTGGENVAIGDQAMFYNTTGATNIAIGVYSMGGATGGEENTVIGGYALQSSTTSCCNVAIGHDTLDSLTTGCNNTAIGGNAMASVTVGNWNIGIGYQSLAFNEGSANIGIGCCAGAASETINNIYIGNCAGFSVAESSGSTFIGQFAGCDETVSNKLHIANCDLCSLIEGSFTGKTVTIDNKLITTDFQMTNGAASGCVLGSDASGNASWVSGGGTSLWTQGVAEICPTTFTDNLTIGQSTCICWDGGVFMKAYTGATNNVWCVDTGTGAYLAFSLSESLIAQATQLTITDSGFNNYISMNNNGQITGNGDVRLIAANSVDGTAACDVCLTPGNNSSTGQAGHIYMKAGTSTSGTDGRIRMDNLPAKSSETCGLWIDASGNLSTGFISGGSGGSVWTQNGGFVHPNTATDSVIISDAECYAWSGGSFIQGYQGCISIRSEGPTTGGGCDICILAGNSNDAQGGDIHIESGFAYSPGGGGDIYITPEIGQGGTGRLYLKNLIDCVSETCVLYTDANGRISKGPASLTVYDFSAGVCEYSADNICLGGAMSGTTTLCLNQNSAQQFLICDCSTTPLVIAMCRHYTTNPAILIGQTLLGNKIVISPSHTDPIQIGGVDTTGCAGIRVGGNCIRMQSYQTCGACVAVTHAGCAIIQGCCGNTTHHGCDALICGGGTTATSGSYHGGHVHICGGAHGGTNGGNIYMCVVDSGDTVMVGLPSQSDETCVLYIDADGSLATGTPSSDCRLKCCVEPITCATSMLDNICGYSAEFNNLSNCEGRCEYVMMAQEVEPDLPLAVKNGVIINDVDYKKIEYDQLIPVMWNIIKEQEARITALESK